MKNESSTHSDTEESETPNSDRNAFMSLKDWEALLEGRRKRSPMEMESIMEHGE